MKKLLVLLFLIPGLGRADAGSAFATGFANALNRSLGGNPNDSRPEPVQQVEVTHYSNPLPSVSDPHWDATSFDNRRGGYYFFNEGECQRFLRRSNGTYTICNQVY